jgi:phosphoglycolate phosphatase-like HAD superfamily hydrolase
MKPYIVIVELDGVLFDCSHRRHLAEMKDWDKFHEACIGDSVFMDMHELICTLSKAEYTVIVVTARPDKFRKLTWEQLRKVGLGEHVEMILMRPSDDFSYAQELKVKLLQEHNITSKNTLVAFEDEERCVISYRNYGIPTYQVR